MFIITKYNGEVLFSAKTKDEVIAKALKAYELTVEEYNGDIVSVNGVMHKEDKGDVNGNI